MAALTSNKITADGTYSLTTSPGDTYVFSAAGTFGSGSLAVKWVDDAGNSTAFDSSPLTAAGSITLRAPTRQLDLVLSGATDPDLTIGLVLSFGSDGVTTDDVGNAMADAAELTPLTSGTKIGATVSGVLKYFSPATLWSFLKTTYLDASLTLAGAKTLSGQLQLTGQSATDANSAMTMGLSDARYPIKTYSRITADESFTGTVLQNSTMALSLTVGLWEINGWIDAQTASATGGIEVIMQSPNAGDSGSGSSLETYGANQTAGYLRYLNGSSEPYLAVFLRDGGGLMVYGPFSVLLYVSTPTTYYVKCSQRSATDLVNPVILKSRSWMTAKKF